MTIKLQFVEHLRHHIVGYRQKPMPVSKIFAVEQDQELHPDGVNAVLRFEAKIGFSQMIARDRIRFMEQEGQEEMLRARERAVRAISRQTFGPIEQELHEILHLLWEEGMHKSEAAKRIEAMIPVLRGEPT